MLEGLEGQLFFEGVLIPMFLIIGAKVLVVFPCQCGYTYVQPT